MKNLIGIQIFFQSLEKKPGPLLSSLPPFFGAASANDKEGGESTEDESGKTKEEERDGLDGSRDGGVGGS